MYYSLEKTAEILDMNPGDVNKLREQGKLRAFRDGAVWKFRKEEVEQYLTDMIKSRSSSAPIDDGADLLSNESDEEGPTMLADSAAFDSMIENVGDDAFVASGSVDDFKVVEDAADEGLKVVEDAADEGLKIVDDAADEGLKVVEDAADEGLKLVEEADEGLKVVEDAADEGLKLVEEADEGLKIDDDADGYALAGESTPLTDEHSALAEDVAPNAEVSSSSAVDLAADANASDDDVLHLGSDSGLSLLDDPDVGGSNISLGDDLVLGGGSSSGGSSGSGLDLTGDSGLALLGDSDGDFQLDEKLSDKLSENISEEIKGSDSVEPEAEVFELAEEDSSSGNVLNLANDVATDAPTELVNVEDSIFDLAADATTSQGTEATRGDDPSESASQFITVDDNNPFLTDVESSALENDPLTVGQSSPASESADIFSVASSDAIPNSEPFGSGASVPSESGGFGVVDSTPDSSVGFGNFGGDSQSVDLGSGSSQSIDIDSSAVIQNGAFAPAPASTNFTGKDMLILVPCLILLLLASIGAWELCRTIWSYEEGVFDLGGPVLEQIAKMVKLM